MSNDTLSELRFLGYSTSGVQRGFRSIDASQARGISAQAQAVIHARHRRARRSSPRRLSTN